MDASKEPGSAAAIARRIALANLAVQVAAEQVRLASDRLGAASRELQEIEDLTRTASFPEPETFVLIDVASSPTAAGPASAASSEDEPDEIRGWHDGDDPRQVLHELAEL